MAKIILRFTLVVAFLLIVVIPNFWGIARAMTDATFALGGLGGLVIQLVAVLALVLGIAELIFPRR